MNRLSLILLLLLADNLTFGQTKGPRLNDNEVYYKSFKKLTEDAKANKFKTVKTYLYKNEKLNNGKLKSIDNYDENGLLTDAIDHRFIKYDTYMQWNYSYDSLGRIHKIVISHSDRLSTTYYQFEYTNDNKVKYSISSYKGEETSKPDTVFYEYFDDGRIKYQLYSCDIIHWSEGIKFVGHHRDTTYYHYNKFGDVSYNDAKVDIIDYRIRDKNGCVIGNTDNDKIITMIRDSLCNELSYKEEILKRDKKVVIRLGESKYIGKSRIETKWYSCPRTVYSNCSGKLKIYYHKKYDYDDKGLITKETSYNSRGKIIKILQTVYETY
jgi:hypothetical protein